MPDDIATESQGLFERVHATLKMLGLLRGLGEWNDRSPFTHPPSIILRSFSPGTGRVEGGKAIRLLRSAVPGAGT